MPFLTLGDLHMAWRLIKSTLPSEMTQFGDYFERTWIGTSSTDPLYDNGTWNQYDGCLARLDRSANIAEGWHNGFRSLLGCDNPTMWKFMDALKLEQNVTDVKWADHLNRKSPPQQEPKWKKFDETLESFIEN